MSFILDLIFPRPYDHPTFYHSPQLLPVKYFFSPAEASAKAGHSPLDGCLSLFKYTGVIRQTIMDIKYRYISDACRSLSLLAVVHLRQSYPNLLKYWQKHHFCVVPIPLHSHRQNWRGFNQSALLGQLIAPKLHLKYAEILIRTRQTVPQVSLKDKLIRSRNLKNVFSTIYDLRSNILLFDDVATTYSTLKSAAKILKKSGAKSVWALTVAGPH